MTTIENGLRRSALAVVLGALVWTGTAAGQETTAENVDDGPAAAGKQAAVSPQQRGPNWLVTCSNSGPDQELRCGMSQSVVLNSTGERLMTVTFRRPDGADEPTMLVRLPLGLYLPHDVVFAVDGEEQPLLEVRTCDAGGCYASRQIPEDLLDTLKGGESMAFTVEDVARREVTFTLTLDGFDRSLTSLVR
jgi:invasion protein IalB